jgi:hypothetical protein
MDDELMFLEAGDPMGCGLDCLDGDDELGNIFGDIIDTVGKIAAAPVNLVASVLPKPAQKAVRTAAGIAMPHLNMDPKVRASVAGQLGIGGKRAAAGGTVFAKPTPAPQSAQAAQVKANAARDIARIAACNRPRLRAKSSGSGKADVAQKALMAKLVADAVAKRVDPRLKAINAKLSLAENQRLATSEHNAINNKTAFRRRVLADLMRIASCLPESHPTRQKIRRVGLMSGLL